MGKKSILAICAHNDDQIIGCGGALTKYASEGYDVTSIIFSYGESSHPWLKRYVTKDMRKKEVLRSNEIMGLGQVIFLGAKEGKFQEYLETGLKQELVSIIKKKNPIKIFTHSVDDPHPDHKTVYTTVRNLVNDHVVLCEAYMFDVWNPIRYKKRDAPKLVVDITKEFKTKIEAFKSHKSQKMTIFTLMWNVYTQALINGLNHNCKYAEVFRRLK